MKEGRKEGREGEIKDRRRKEGKKEMKGEREK